MRYNNLDEIYAEKALALDAIERTVLPLSVPQTKFVRSEGEWSVADVVEHLSIVESAQIRLFQVLTVKAESAGGRSTGNVDLSIDDRFRDSANGKIITRPQSAPKGTQLISESLNDMHSVQEVLFGLRPRLEKVDLSAVKFQHPSLGELTIGQWLIFFAVHEQRHLGQITSVMSSPSFPRI